MFKPVKSLALLILISIFSLFIINCGSNSNDLAIPGKNCLPTIDENSLEPDENDRSNQKVGAKLTFDTLPEGEYEVSDTTFLVVQLFNGERQLRRGMRAYAKAEQKSEQQLEKDRSNHKPGDEPVVSHNFGFGCLSLKPKGVVDYSMTGLTSFKKTAAGFEDLSANDFKIYFAGGANPTDKMTFTKSESVAVTGTPSEFYLAGDHNGANHAAVVFASMVEDENGQKNTYEIRQEFKSDDLLLRLKITLEKK